MVSREDILNSCNEVKQITLFCTVGGKRRLGRVVCFNSHTVLLKIMSGAKSSFIIKRHNKKHNLVVHSF